MCTCGEEKKPLNSFYAVLKYVGKFPEDPKPL